MGSNYKITYNVDIVFTVDATGSMDHILDMIKDNALKFYQDVAAAMAKLEKDIGRLRVRLVEFRDFMEDKENAMIESPFFTLPDQAEDFKAVVDHLTAVGGGDDPEDGLEALACAISPNHPAAQWCQDGDKRRHVIVVWSDDAAHELGFGKKSGVYPDGMPKDFHELTQWWETQMNRNFKRLIIYAPDVYPWKEISNRWKNVIHIPTATKGLKEVEYNHCIKAIAKSV